MKMHSSRAAPSANEVALAYKNCLLHSQNSLLSRSFERELAASEIINEVALPFFAPCVFRTFDCGAVFTQKDISPWKMHA